MPGRLAGAGGEDVGAAGGLVEGGEEGGVEGVIAVGGDGGQEDDADFAASGDGREMGELAVDVEARGVVFIAEHHLGVVDDDHADGAVLMEDLGELVGVGGAEWPGGLVTVHVGLVGLGDGGDDEDGGEVDV